MDDSTSPQIQQPQPGLPPPGFVPGPPIPGQVPVIPGQQSVVQPAIPGQTSSADAPPATDQAPVAEENACETLYIQNLNEKVKPTGVFPLISKMASADRTLVLASWVFWLNSDESDPSRLVQVIWRGP